MIEALQENVVAMPSSTTNWSLADLQSVIAQHWGLTAPWWFAFVGSGITLALVWGQLGRVAHAKVSAVES